MSGRARLLLLSTSTIFGGEYLAYAEPEIRDFLGEAKRILFVPFALHDHDAYAGRARKRFTQMGCTLDSIHRAANMHDAVDSTDAVFIGGGNTFRLLKALYDHDLLGKIRER